jgi:hypothetical protein
MQVHTPTVRSLALSGVSISSIAAGAACPLVTSFTYAAPKEGNGVTIVTPAAYRTD